MVRSLATIGTNPQIGVYSSVTLSLFRIVESLGIDPKLLETCFQDKENLSKPYAKISLNEFIRAVEKTVEITGYDNFPIMYGSKCDIESLGLLGYIFINSKNLKHALESTCKYFLFFQEYTTLKVEKHGEYYVVTYKVDDSYLENQRYDAEITLAIICNLIRKATNSDWQPALIEFENSEPAFIGDHLAFFKCTLNFNARKNSIYIPKKDVEAKILGADPHLFEILTYTLENIGYKNNQNEKFIDFIVMHIKLCMETKFPHIEDIAKLTGIPTWTLKRRLSSYNTSFSVLLENTQKELSPQYLLEPDSSISEVAYKLGYSDISSFSKAFQRWYGMSPKHWISQQP
ncbi:AraC family transcriptional regulator [Acinetobacter sp. MB5]|uniref:AraC family transcriptional regulator n=1 Tax=Acinetobacter sp. MB5 TaxID=2069438 RepID=UPI0013A6F6A9|nr:AraC family transcriptional regulator [Acinetobacter sp. MB5]